MMPIIGAEELAGVQDYAVAQMTTPLTIYTQTLIEHSPQYDYGDDYTAFPGYDTSGVGFAALGHFRNKPTPVAMDTGGQIITVSGLILYLPVGTPIKPGDLVVGYGGQEFVVADTGNESTWPASLVCSLREVENVAQEAP